MPREYKTVSITTVAELKAAERLQANGWTQGRVGLFTIQFYRDKPAKPAKKAKS